MTRANPFENLDDFTPKTESKPVKVEQIDRIATEMGFPSRQPITAANQAVPKSVSIRRRYTTGRNQQLNIKATAETVELFYRLADQQNVPLGELLERALTALEQATRNDR